MSLRTKVVALVLGLLALLSAAVAVATDLALQRFLVGRLDNQLRTANGRTANALQGHGSPDGVGATRRELTLTDALNRQGPGALVARITAAGVVTAAVRTEVLDAVPVPPEDLPALAAVPVDGRVHAVHLDHLEHGGQQDYRMLATRAPDGDISVTGLSTAGVDATVLRLGLIELAVTLAALALAAAAALGLLRLALRPLRRVAATARRVAELPLDRGEVALAERVPDADTDPRTEVGQVGAALNSLLGHVSKALQARQASESRVRQFVADASHELRTPLASIRGYAELSRRSPEPVPSDVAHAMRRVESEAVRMTSLVEDLLLLARLDSGRPLEHEPVDLSRLLVDAVGDAHAAGPEHRWHLDLPERPVFVTGDAARLHQVVTNLLSNGRTHTPAGTTVTARVTAQNGTAVIAVDDDGPGVSAALLPTVFERFARADTSRSRATGSTGLGLAIVSAVVHAHGGTVEVTSRPGRTSFLVRLPLRVPAPVS